MFTSNVREPIETPTWVPTWMAIRFPMSICDYWKTFSEETQYLRIQQIANLMGKRWNSGKQKRYFGTTKTRSCSVVANKKLSFFTPEFLWNRWTLNRDGSSVEESGSDFHGRETCFFFLQDLCRAAFGSGMWAKQTKLLHWIKRSSGKDYEIHHK